MNYFPNTEAHFKFVMVCTKPIILPIKSFVVSYLFSYVKKIFFEMAGVRGMNFYCHASRKFVTALGSGLERHPSASMSMSVLGVL